MIKLIDILSEENEQKPKKILVPRRIDQRQERAAQILNQKIQKYIEDGCKDELDLLGSSITSLPNNLHKVGGDLYLGDTKITSLPNNLHVEGTLYLYMTPIISLPDDLTVGYDFDLSNSKISSIPNNLKIGGELFLLHTPLAKKYTKQQIRQMIEDKGGYVKFINAKEEDLWPQ